MKAKHNGGFTLIELLVVITIIAILASFAVPVFNKVVAGAQQTKQVNNAKQIAVACNVYAADLNGIFPNGTFKAETGRLDPSATASEVAEDCFGDLVDSKKLDVEKVFWSPQHASGATPQCAASPPDEIAPLEGKENCWDYVVGLNNSSNASLPIVFEASDGGGGTKWTSISNEGSHPWENAVIIAFVDGSATKEQIGSDGTVLKGDGTTNLCEVTPAAGFPGNAKLAAATPGS